VSFVRDGHIVRIGGLETRGTVSEKIMTLAGARPNRKMARAEMQEIRIGAGRIDHSLSASARKAIAEAHAARIV